jgi:PAS domain S-box-containing protein
MSHLTKRGWRWLRDFADRRLDHQMDVPSVKLALGSVLLRWANRLLEGRLLTVSATGASGALPFSEATRQGLLLNAMDVAVYTTDLEGRVTLFNDAAVALWGRRPVIGDARWCGAWKLYTAEGAPLPHDQCPMAVALREQRPIRGVEAIAERPDGSRVPFIPHPTPLFDTGGRCIGAVNVLVDITDRKEAEQRRLLLAREVDHRAKNLLAVVQAMVRMTRSEDPQRFVEVLNGRLAALANAHTLLAADGWNGADLRTVAERELSPYLSAGRVTLWGPVLQLTPTAVQPVAMLLHELATNAAKHGALSAPAGKLSLTWEQDQAGMLRLLWRESGGQGVTKPTRRSFGSRLIESLTRLQLGGTVQEDWRKDGLRCTITVAAAHLRCPEAVVREAA